MTVWIALFLATLAPAVWVGVRRGGDSAIIACVLAASFLGAHMAWATPDPLLSNAVSDLICGLIIVIGCTERWTNGVVVLFLLAVACSVVARFFDLPDYAHVLSGMGHAQNIALLIGGGIDARKSRRIRDPPGAMVLRD